MFLLVPAHLGSPGQRAVKRLLCVVAVVRYMFCLLAAWLSVYLMVLADRDVHRPKKHRPVPVEPMPGLARNEPQSGPARPDCAHDIPDIVDILLCAFVAGRVP